MTMTVPSLLEKFENFKREADFYIKYCHICEKFEEIFLGIFVDNVQKI